MMDNCEKMQELLEAYADGALSHAQKAQVEAHVAHCPHCAALLDEHLALHAAIANCAEKAPEGFADRVMQTVANQPQLFEKRQERGVRFGRVASLIGIAAAAMICIGVAGTALVRHMTQNLGNMENVEQEETAAGGFMPGAPINPEEDAVSNWEEPSLEHPATEQVGTKDDCVEEMPTYPETAKAEQESEPVQEDAAPTEEATTRAPESESESESETDELTEEQAGEQDV